MCVCYSDRKLNPLSKKKKGKQNKQKFCFSSFFFLVILFGHRIPTVTRSHWTYAEKIVKPPGFSAIFFFHWVFLNRVWVDWPWKPWRQWKKMASLFVREVFIFSFFRFLCAEWLTWPTILCVYTKSRVVLQRAPKEENQWQTLIFVCVCLSLCYHQPETRNAMSADGPLMIFPKQSLKSSHGSMNLPHCFSFFSPRKLKTRLITRHWLSSPGVVKSRTSVFPSNWSNRSLKENRDVLKMFFLFLKSFKNQGNTFHKMSICWPHWPIELTIAKRCHSFSFIFFLFIAFNHKAALNW